MLTGKVVLERQQEFCVTCNIRIAVLWIHVQNKHMLTEYLCSSADKADLYDHLKGTQPS